MKCSSADSADILPLLWLYEANSAEILPLALLYEADLAAILPFFCDLKPILLPSCPS